MQDEIFSRLLAKVKPGMRDTDITALAQYEGRLLGSEQGLFLGTSAPLGVRSGFADRYQQGRTLKAGEHFTMLIENNGPGGFYTELARTMVFGKATQQLQDGFAAMKAAQDHTLSLIRPGASCRHIAAAHDEYMRAHGLPPGAAALLPWPGLRSGRAPAGAGRRDHDACGRHEPRGASGLRDRRACSR